MILLWLAVGIQLRVPREHRTKQVRAARSANATAPEFVVEDGNCTTTGQCVSSPGWPGNYPSSGNSTGWWCDLRLTADAYITATAFETEACCDHLMIEGIIYGGHEGPHDVAVPGGSKISWRPDSSVNAAGWRLCASATEGSQVNESASATLPSTEGSQVNESASAALPRNASDWFVVDSPAWSTPCPLRGACVASPGWPHSYDASPCHITMRRDAYLVVEHFATEQCCDHLVVGDYGYSGSNAPSNTHLMAGASFDWSPDMSIHGSGWVICAVEDWTEDPPTTTTTTTHVDDWFATMGRAYNPCSTFDEPCKRCLDSPVNASVWNDAEDCRRRVFCDGTCDACEQCDWSTNDTYDDGHPCLGHCAPCWEAQAACEPCSAACLPLETCWREVHAVPIAQDGDLCFEPCAGCEACMHSPLKPSDKEAMKQCFEEHPDAPLCARCLNATLPERREAFAEGPAAVDVCAPCWESSIWDDCDKCTPSCEPCEHCFDAQEQTAANSAPEAAAAPPAAGEPAGACDAQCGVCNECAEQQGLSAGAADAAQRQCQPIRDAACADCDKCWSTQPPMPPGADSETRRVLRASLHDHCDEICSAECYAPSVDQAVAQCLCDHDPCCETCRPCRACAQEHGAGLALVHAPAQANATSSTGSTANATALRAGAAVRAVVRTYPTLRKALREALTRPRRVALIRALGGTPPQWEPRACA